MTDSFAQIPPGSTGLKIATSELVNDSSQTVERQQIVVGDPLTYGNKLSITAAGAAKVDASATIQPISVATLPLPQGAAQDGTDGGSAPAVPTGGTGIRGWLASIYQKLAATLAVTQSGVWTVATTGADGSQATIGNTGDASTVTTLVGLLKAIKAFLAGTLTVGGTVTANAGTGTLTVGQATGSNLHVAVDALPTLPGGTNAIGGVTTVGSGTLIDDTATVTTVAAALNAHVGNDFQIQNDPGSFSDVYLGNSAGQHTRLQPGMSQPVPVTNTNLIYVKTLIGTATVNILGRS